MNVPVPRLHMKYASHTDSQIQNTECRNKDSTWTSLRLDCTWNTPRAQIHKYQIQNAWIKLAYEHPPCTTLEIHKLTLLSMARKWEYSSTLFEICALPRDIKILRIALYFLSECVLGRHLQIAEFANADFKMQTCQKSPVLLVWLQFGSLPPNG